MDGILFWFPDGYHFVIIMIPLFTSFLVWDIFILSSYGYSCRILLETVIVQDYLPWKYVSSWVDEKVECGREEWDP